MLNHKKLFPKDSGFTLVEMLIVAPIVILMIGIFISSIVSMTGDVLSTRMAATLSYNVQDALDRIEQDVKASGAFLSKNNVVIASPQGYNNDTTNFSNVSSNPSTGPMLILNSYATTGNPASSSSTIMYMSNQPYSCSNSQLNQNQPVMYNIVYFVKNNALWRRVLMPSNYLSVGCSGGAIGSPWQQPSCASGSTGTMCVTQDVKLVEGIDPENSGFSISYYTNTGSTTENADASNSTKSDSIRQAALKTTAAVGVTINASTTSAGRIISQSGTMRATGLNNNSDPTADTNWIGLTFQNSWTNYGYEYNNGSYRRTSDGVVNLKGLLKKNGTFVSNEIIATLPVGYRPSEQLIFQTSTMPNAASRVDVDTSGNIRVVVGDASWVSIDGITFLPSDSPYTYTALTPIQNGWVAYNTGFATPSYAIDASGRVHTKGLVKSGTTTDNTPIVTLPSNARPSMYMHVPNDNSNGFGMIGISNSGNIVAKGGGNSYLSLQSVFFPSNYSNWTNLVLQNSWVVYDAVNYSTPQYTKAPDGLVSIKGLIKNGTTTGGTVLANLPVGYRPAKRILYSAITTGAYSRIDIESNGNISIISGTNNWLSLDGMTFYADQ